MVRKSVVTVYVRHRATCEQAGNSFYRGCACAKWLRYSGAVCFCGYQHKGNQHKVAADTRSWALAEEKAHELQRRLNAGDLPTPAAAVSRPTSALPTIAAAVETFILGKRGEGVGTSTITKLKSQLGGFERFMAARSKFFPSEITPTDVIEYRATWKSWSDLTQIKAQTNLRGFIRFCCGRENRDDVIAALKTIKETREGKTRRKPKPFSEAELTKLLAQVSKTFPDATRTARMTALIHCMVSTGLAITDTIQLQRDSIREGWLRIERQKTGRSVTQKLEPALYQELLHVTNGNPKYVFWNGKSLPHSAVGVWQADLRKLMEDAGVWIKGNLSHRFRDTACDFWLGAGCTMVDIAGMLGDKVAIVEKHYADLASKRMEERLAKVPMRSWADGK